MIVYLLGCLIFSFKKDFLFPLFVFISLLIPVLGPGHNPRYDYLQEITALLSERAKVKTIVEHNIISCNAKLSTIKNEISELVNSNPRNRRMSRHFKALNFGALSGGGARDSRRVRTHIQ